MLNAQEIPTVNLVQGRKMIHNFLNTNVAGSYVPYRDLKNKQMTYEIWKQPAQLFDSIRRNLYL